ESVQQKQMATLERLGLDLAPVSFSTTAERITARMRLASPGQLGAHTPRPKAPSDAWFSLQLHQSALNNCLEQLDLSGRQFTLPELFAWLAKKLDKPEMVEQEELPEDVRVTFAQENAVRLSCQADHVEVTFRIAELRQARRVWRDFSVKAHYVPQPNPL